jgi:hypothetical protein
MDFEPGPNFWNQNCNLSYSTTAGDNVKLTLEALLDTIEKLPTIPKIFVMPIDVIRSNMLPDNFMLVSKSVADALEAAFKENSTEEVESPKYWKSENSNYPEILDELNVCVKHGGSKLREAFMRQNNLTCFKCREEKKS